MGFMATMPKLKRPPKHNILLSSRRKSGTKIAYEYALKKINYKLML